jgi:hypothetical protein
MSRHIDVAKRGHGPVRVIFHAEDPDRPDVLTLAQRVRLHILWEKNRQAMKAIDKDFRRGGFSADMRHAR